MKVALTGPVQLELITPYFVKAGYGVAVPGEIPDVTCDVTAFAKVLADEVPGFYDPRMESLAGCPYSLAGIEAIVEEFRWWVMRTPKKVLAVDADNTLWHGILSEDGPEALVPCTEFQKGLKQLADDGVVLVLLSKNDPGSIALDWFAISRVNWAPKPGNLIEVCRELNLPLDSVVFVDDNPHERAQMQAHLPEVTVAPWSGWGEEKVKGKGEGEGEGEGLRERQLIRRLREYFFGEVGKTSEDRLRTADYRRQREGAALLPRNRDEYLRDLGLWVEARPAEMRDLDRLAQMAGKTNQFNCTTLRRSRSDFEYILCSTSGLQSSTSIFVFRAGDRFGEQGIVGYVIIDGAARRMTDFVMSCRAMGRTLEHFMYEWMASRLGYRPVIDFVSTAKNAPAKEFVELVAKGAELKTYYHSI